MGFKIIRIAKLNNDFVVDRVQQDYHNGDCTILIPLSDLETIGDDLKYLVVDFKDYLVLIYPQKTDFIGSDITTPEAMFETRDI